MEGRKYKTIDYDKKNLNKRYSHSVTVTIWLTTCTDVSITVVASEEMTSSLDTIYCIS